MAYLFTDRCLQMALLIGILTTGLDASLVQTPSNTVDIIGSSVILFCNSTLTSTQIQWVFTTHGGENNISFTSTIVSGCVSQSPNYTTESNSTGQCNLVINSLTLYHAGRYTCNDTTDARSAQLGVIDSHPTCTLDNINPPIEGKHIFINSKVEFYNNFFKVRFTLNNIESYANYFIPTYYTFGGPPRLYALLSAQIGTGVDLERPRLPPYLCNTTLIFDTSKNLSSGDATNQPAYRHSMQLEAVMVLYRPLNNTMNITEERNNTSAANNTQLTCSADAYPSPSYKWTGPTGSVTYGPVITISTGGSNLLYRCTAMNGFGSVSLDYIVNEQTITTVTVTTQTSGSPLHNAAASFSTFCAIVGLFFGGQSSIPR